MYWQDKRNQTFLNRPVVTRNSQQEIFLKTYAPNRSHCGRDCPFEKTSLNLRAIPFHLSAKCQLYSLLAFHDLLTYWCNHFKVKIFQLLVFTHFSDFIFRSPSDLWREAYIEIFPQEVKFNIEICFSIFNFVLDLITSTNKELIKLMISIIDIFIRDGHLNTICMNVAINVSFPNEMITNLDIKLIRIVN